jgi:hypothetical protein
MLLSLVSHTALFVHGNMAHARDFYLCAYWSVGSGCVADMIMTFTISVLRIAVAALLFVNIAPPTHTFYLTHMTPPLFTPQNYLSKA